MARQYTKKEIEEIRKTNPTFRLSKSEALSYAAEMGASDSLRGIQQMGAELFGFDDTVKRLKEKDRKLRSILDNQKYGNAAMGTFLSSAVIADPIGWIPILGTAKKAKNIYQLGKYGAMAGGFHSGIGYVSEDTPGLIGEKQTRLENTLIGTGAGVTLGTISGGVVNAIAKARGKPMVYGLTKDIEVPSQIGDTPLPRIKSDKELEAAKIKEQDDYYASFGGGTKPIKSTTKQQDEYYEGRFSEDLDKDKAIDAVVKENSKEGPQKVKGILKFYQDIFGNKAKDIVFNNAGTSLLGFGGALGGWNNDRDAPLSEKFTTAILWGFGAGVGTNMIGRIRTGNELLSEKVARKFIDDYGLPDDYKVLRDQLRLNTNSYASKFLKLAKEAQEKLSKDERRIFYNLMSGDIDNINKLATKEFKVGNKITAPDRKNKGIIESIDGEEVTVRFTNKKEGTTDTKIFSLDEIKKTRPEAIDTKDLSKEGLRITAETRELIREMGQKYIDEGLLNRKVFLRNVKTYLHRSYQRSLVDPETKKSIGSIREISLIGDNLKPRGDVDDLSISDYKLKKDKLKEQGYKVLEKYETSSGKKRVIVRRDYTKEERVEMGEIEDLAFAIAETGRLMSNDVATARFFKQIARNKNFTSDVKKEGFVEVDTTSIAGKTNVKKYGELAGKWVHEDVYNDITRLYKLKSKTEMQGVYDAFETMQRTWKLSKTAWNPATHMNNTVSNFLLLDFSDTKMEMLVKALSEFKKGDKSELLQLGKKYGIFDVDVISRELKKTTSELGGEIMKGLGKISNIDNVKDTANYSNNLWKALRKAKEATLGKMEKAYQFEDQVFRMAVFMDRVDKGFDINKAAMEARKWFIDYDINAPAINLMRKSFTPFISYTYRVIPLLAEAAILRPHKFAKWAAIGYGLNEIGNQLGGGNEELERVTMRDELSKNLYDVPFMPPRMIKLGWNTEEGDSQYIDIGRFIPGGDIFEQREAGGFKFPGVPTPFQPGGLLIDIPLILGTKENPFTGQSIEGLGVGKDFEAVTKAVLQNLTPNVPGLPGSYSTEKIQRAINIQEGEPYYNIPGSKYAAKYTPLEALVYGFGIKLRPQNIHANRELKVIDYQMEVKQLKDTRNKLKAQFRNGDIATKKELDKKLADIDLHMLKLAAEWQVYERKLNKARAKGVVPSRKQKAIGGLVEGKEAVPFTKQNPADRVNPFTGLPYQQADLTEGGVLSGLLRNRMDRVGFQDGGSLSTDEAMKDFILKAEDINLYNDYKAGNLEKTVKAHTGSKRYKDLHGKSDKETLAGVTGAGVSETTVGDAVDNIFQKALNETQQEYNRLVPEDVQNNRSINDQRALFSLLFNVGATNLQNSETLKAFKEDRMSDFYKEGFDRDFGFTKVTGSDGEKRKDIGLVNRRKAELKLAQGSLESPMEIEEVVLPTRVSLKDRLEKRRTMND